MYTDLKEIYNENICYVYEKEFLPGQIKTRGHDHFSNDGKICGLSHQSCNINLCITYFLPVIIHNYKNYDAHLIWKHIPENYAESNSIIPVN